MTALTDQASTADRHLHAVPSDSDTDSDQPAADTRDASLKRASELIGLEVIATRKRGREPGRSRFDMSIVDRHGIERTVTIRTEDLLGRRLMFALAAGVGHIPPRAWTPTGRREIAAALLRGAVDGELLELAAA